MKYLLSLALVLFIASKSEAATDGCYMDQFSSPYCSSSLIFCTFDYSQDLAKFGYSIAHFCSIYYLSATEGDQCKSNISACIKNRDQNFKIANDNYKAGKISAGQVKKYKALEKRLRKVCGSKCKAVKL